jgi:hypothetical protein
MNLQLSPKLSTPELASSRKAPMKPSGLRIPIASVHRTRFKAAALLLLFGASVLGYAQDAAPAAVQTTEPVKQIHVMRLTSGLSDSGRLRGQRKLQAGVRQNVKPANTGAGIIYTCDPSVAAATCNYLNTTVAGYYNSTFTNANANIYITYGTTSLGASDQYLNLVTYDQYVAALTSNTNKSAVQTSALSALGTYDATPYGSGDVEVTTALGTTLGFSGTTGINVSGGACTPGSTGCYNVIITVTNDPDTPLYYDNLGGTEPDDAYDFYAVVQHETDEALGTSSCIDTQTDPLSDECDFAGGSGVPSAVDLFRYSSPGELVLDSSLSITPGAYFSYNGGTDYGAYGLAGDPKIYNTLDNLDDYADFISSSPDCGTNEAIQDAEGCPGEDAGLTILNDGGAEITILNAVGYDVSGAGAQVTLSTTSLTFPSTAAGSTSTLPLTVTNTGTANLTVTGISNTGTNPTDFSHTSNCGGVQVARGGHCTIQVSFSPAAGGSFSAKLNITDNATGSPQSVTLSGTGTAGATAVTLSPTSLSFPKTAVGSTSTFPVTVTNSGGTSLTVTAIGTTGTNAGDFSHTSNCGGVQVAPGGHCTIQVSFTPSAGGSFSANLNITDNATGSPQSVTLSGTGTAVTLSPTSLSFPKTAVGSTSTFPVTVTNSGGTSLTVTAIGTTGTNAGDFSHTSNCGGVQVAPGGHCTIQVSFTPSGSGSFSATLTITDNASGSPQSVPLSGTGTAATSVTLSANSLSFPSTAAGSTSTLPVTVTNSGGTSLTVTAIGTTGTNPTDFTHTSTCGGVQVAPGGHCTIEVSFTPSAAGSFSATLNITDNATGSPQSVTLSGTGH